MMIRITEDERSVATEDEIYNNAGDKKIAIMN